MSKMIESFMNESRAGLLRPQPIALGEVEDLQEAGAALRCGEHPLHVLKVQLQVRVGSATLTVGELMAARENQVLALDRAVDAPVDLLLEGRTVARGQLVAVEDTFAVRITELPLPLKF